ncbi:MAG TPA: selenide, water dikinase SelD [Thermoanaerobaculia bacterium]|nr:selenide, water dikinase SelD [Thermoanaerobaculia bacterium]
MGQDDLRSVLGKLPSYEGVGDLLVGTASGDDAAVLRIIGEQAIVQTVDFFTPIVDDPFLFGSIAAANSISDVYAMGAKPVLGLAVAGFPTDRLPLSVLEEILRGGAEKAAEAGFPVGGGHTIIDDVPKYGLAVTGVVQIDRLVRNSTARAGDLLYLTKPVGNGILVSAFRARSSRRFFRRPGPDLDEAIRWMLQLNAGAAAAMVEAGASAATDVTGYGLIGHLREMCDGAGLGAEIVAGAVPVLTGTREYLARGYRPEGTLRNLATFSPHVRSSVPESELTVMCDAQTSGGLLIAMAPERANVFESAAARGGLLCAKVGRMNDERGVISLVP